MTPKVSNKDTILLKWRGRFGNRMHIFAYLATRSKILNGCIFLPSHWEGSRIFNLQYNLTNKQVNYKNLNTSKINTSDAKFNYSLSDAPALINDHCCYHSSIFEKMNKDHLLNVFKFNDFIKNLDIYKKIEDLQGSYSVAHYRRLDLGCPKNKTHAMINPLSYKRAFKKFDIDPDKIHWVSDISLHQQKDFNFLDYPPFQKLWGYPEGSVFNDSYGFDWLVDFLKMYFSKNLFRPYSSFSFWAGFLSQNREVPPKVFCPITKEFKDFKNKTLDIEFIEGNHTHWASGLHPNLPELIIN